MTLFRPHQPRIGRRGLLLGLTALAALGQARLAVASPASTAGRGEARLVVVLLRGALDGLAVVQPYGDAALRELRGPLALPEPGQEGGLLELGGFFGLHPSMDKVHALYQRNEALVLHAVAGPYRTRSHFDAQDLMESGAESRLSSGWLNRALQAMAPDPAQGARAGLALGYDLPLLLRGPRPVSVYTPQRGEAPPAELYARLADLAHDDPLLGPAVQEGLRARGYASGVLDQDRGRNAFPVLAATAGRLLAEADGPRIAALELGGWDTHSSQSNRLRGQLGQLDDGLEALRSAAGPAWRHTAVLVMTEFGRTVRVNGTGGTDHGTGGAALLLGGAVAGGKVVADWPGLGRGKLFEDRDLQPSLDLREAAKALLRDHLRLPDAALAAAFPGSEGVAPKRGLLRG
ncbi:DUF1501 domain-containing protein [Teichococcus cervicalis]|uniref:Tat pathway signal sequence domain protein n=1 Tax=Pseudoroseomonas cervicalis ATCC 49957 TaxID=525371 RepID=D5RPI1_9PROT|nr:DUF1501 domain-containing protein [Pseudoroseomonas cervicalis]EFH10776.1 Tat pathway signal sequence domain protein [Pseudoroseomonas cervicalis ATCC 49957]